MTLRETLKIGRKGNWKIIKSSWKTEVEGGKGSK